MNRRRRPRPQGADRGRAIARFIYEAAVEHGVHIRVTPSLLGEASVSTWAPNARSPELQVAAQNSFRQAVEENIGAVRRFADSLRTHPPPRGN